MFVVDDLWTLLIKCFACFSGMTSWSVGVAWELCYCQMHWWWIVEIGGHDSRSSHQRCSFTKFTGKHLCQNLLFNKAASLHETLLKNDALAQVFSCELYEISKNTFCDRIPPVAASASILVLILAVSLQYLILILF